MNSRVAMLWGSHDRVINNRQTAMNNLEDEWIKAVGSNQGWKGGADENRTWGAAPSWRCLAVLVCGWPGVWLAWCVAVLVCGCPSVWLAWCVTNLVCLA